MVRFNSNKHLSPVQLETQTAHYIAEISGELAIMANRVGLDLVAYLLSMAHAAAEGAAERTEPKQ